MPAPVHVPAAWGHAWQSVPSLACAAERQPLSLEDDSDAVGFVRERRYAEQPEARLWRAVLAQAAADLRHPRAKIRCAAEAWFAARPCVK